MKLILTVIMILMAACTVEGGLSDQDRDKLMKCTDTRDGEVFYYNTNTVRNVRIGIGGPSSAEITTTSGRKITATTQMNEYIKCADVSDK